MTNATHVQNPTAGMASMPSAARTKLPPGRSLEQVWNHFDVERRLANKLKSADRTGRRLIYETMYDELFRLVPDHPRLTRAVDERRTQEASANKLTLIEPYLTADSVIAEIAPGDCRFLAQIAPRVKRAYGVDISDQRPPAFRTPSNLQLIVYDGYDTSEIADASLDLVFSDQLIEHFHPDDTADHFRLVKRLLKPGGKYVFRTPHAHSGPHDVSVYFSDVALGFHLKEWTYSEMRELLAKTGFRHCDLYWARSRFHVALPKAYFRFWEAVLPNIPRPTGVLMAKALVPTIEIVARA